jgi:sarcosine oxidase subunit alpha
MIRRGHMPDLITIVVDGRPLRVPATISLAAALWNSGVAAVRTSVAGEARGPLCGMGSCQECRVTIDDVLQRRACLEPVREGMRVTTRD